MLGAADWESGELDSDPQSRNSYTQSIRVQLVSKETGTPLKGTSVSHATRMGQVVGTQVHQAMSIKDSLVCFKLPTLEWENPTDFIA